ncbi:MAG: hypothetical protein J6P87_06885 [Lachnospiraceae bacterium]|nr:hypothetical protein [Lachnospiraceae bacterium]
MTDRQRPQLKRSIKILFSVLRCVLFLFVLLVSLCLINQALLPKFTDESNPSWPMTSSYFRFYKMDKDSVDVLFLGSSVVENAFDPQAIYDEYGIRSYNLGSEQQSAFLSYYWLKEALRSQSPEAVVLDTHFLYTMHAGSAINTEDAFIRKCLDPMRLSPVKAEAVRELCRLDPSQSALSFYFTNLRYHTRWKSLTEADLVRAEYEASPLKGFGVITEPGPERFEPFIPGNTQAAYAFDPVTAEYMDRIAGLCRENGITLILCSLPGTNMDDGLHNSLNAFASRHGLMYLNLGTPEYYAGIGAVLPKENTVQHQNIFGAQKTSLFIGRVLADIAGVEGARDPQYENTRAHHDHILQNARLVNTSDLADYLDLLKDCDDVVFMTSFFDVASLYTPEIYEKMQALGLHIDMTDRSGHSYIAILEPGRKPVEETNKGPLTVSGSIRDHRTFYTVRSGDYKIVDFDLIDVDGRERAPLHHAGLNIVVYDPVLRRVIDSVVVSPEGFMR